MKIAELPRFYIVWLLFSVSGWANEFTMFDCMQMFHNKHPCNKQELLAYRWQTTTCDRIQSQVELHVYRTCLGHAGIRIQEICNVCSFFTYPMICSKEKSKRLLRCLGDQFLMQGHGEEAIVAARLCGNVVRSHETSTTMTTQPIQPTLSGNSWKTTPIPREDVLNSPYNPQPGQPSSGNIIQPRSLSASGGPTPRTQFFRTATKKVLKEDKHSKKETQIKQKPIRPGQPIPAPAKKTENGVRAEEDRDDISVEADAQEQTITRKVQPAAPPGPPPKFLPPTQEPPNRSVTTVVDQVANPSNAGTAINRGQHSISEGTTNPRYNIPAFPVRQQLPPPPLGRSKKHETSQTHHTAAPNLQFV